MVMLLWNGFLYLAIRTANYWEDLTMEHVLASNSVGLILGRTTAIHWADACRVQKKVIGLVNLLLESLKATDSALLIMEKTTENEMGKLNLERRMGRHGAAELVYKSDISLVSPSG